MIKHFKQLTQLLCMLGLSNIAYAISIDTCFNIASRHYEIPVKLLKAVAQTESRFDPLAINMNSNNSYDIGIMQINSYWLPKLSKVGIEKAELFDACKNIQIGAWILAQNIKQYGFNAQAIGAYNSPTPELQKIYASKVMRNLK